MAKSAVLRARDVRALYLLAGECRELGDDRLAWRDHLMIRLCDLVDADGSCTGEMAGCRAMKVRDLGVKFWWRPGLARPRFEEAHLEAFRDDPRYSPAMLEYHRVNARFDGLCLARTDFIEDGDWYRSHDFQRIHRPFGVDHMLYCFRSLPGPGRDEHAGILVQREEGRRDFGPRERRLVREAMSLVAANVGGPLARFGEPSPSDLPPRVRDVLACVLEGDGDKQVAARLKLSTNTVNEYLRRIYRHFAVRSRSELLARWVRRDWGGKVSARHPREPRGSGT